MKQLIKTGVQYLNTVNILIVDFIKLVLVLMRTALTLKLKPNITKRERKKDLYILGNGPSLQNFTSAKIDRNKISLCTVNFSVLTNLFFDLKPDVHVFADGAFFKDEIPQVKEIYRIFLHKVDWELDLIVPITVKNIVDKRLKDNGHIHVKGYRINEWEPRLLIFKSLKFYLYSKNIICPHVQNVCVACIFNGINMGYKKIYLYGVEHSWLNLMMVNDENIVCLKNQHFYNNEPEYTPFYISDPNGPVFKMHEALEALSKMFYGYFCLKEYANYLGDINIINRTKGSFIDAFDRE